MSGPIAGHDLQSTGPPGVPSLRMAVLCPPLRPGILTAIKWAFILDLITNRIGF